MPPARRMMRSRNAVGAPAKVPAPGEEAAGTRRGECRRTYCASHVRAVPTPAIATAQS